MTVPCPLPWQACLATTANTSSNSTHRNNRIMTVPCPLPWQACLAAHGAPQLLAAVQSIYGDDFVRDTTHGRPSIAPFRTRAPALLPATPLLVSALKRWPTLSNLPTCHLFSGASAIAAYEAEHQRDGQPSAPCCLWICVTKEMALPVHLFSCASAVAASEPEHNRHRLPVISMMSPTLAQGFRILGFGGV